MLIPWAAVPPALGAEEILQCPHGHALGPGAVLNEADLPLRDVLPQGDAADVPRGDGRGGHGLRAEADAEAAADHGKDLVHGGGLHVHPEGQVVPGEELLIEVIGPAAAADADEGLPREIPEAHRHPGQLLVLPPADQDLPEAEEGRGAQRLGGLEGRGHHGEVRVAVAQGGDGLGGGSRW